MMTMTNKNNAVSEGGFTLLELMVVLAILSLMTLMTWQIWHGMMRSFTRSAEYDEVYQYARVVMRRLSDDLSGAFMLGPLMKGSTEGIDQGIRESAFVGVDSGREDKLDFASFSHRRLRRNSAESDTQEVGYQLTRDPDNPDTKLLMRREAVFLDGKIDEGGESYPVARRVKSFNIEYYDGTKKEWGSQWNSTSREWLNRLPNRVKVEVVFANPQDGGADIPFTMIMGIPLWASPVEF